MLNNIQKEKSPEIYGPFVRKDENDKWHFDKSCPHYPKVKDPEVKFTSFPPEVNELCGHCRGTL